MRYIHLKHISILWAASAIFIFLCGISTFCFPLPAIFISLFFKILVFSCIFIFIIELIPKKNTFDAVKDLNLLPDESYYGPIRENMYIRSRHCFGKEERYVLDLEGHVYYKFVSRRRILNYNRWRRFNIYCGFSKKIGTVLRYRVGKSELYRYKLKIGTEEFHARITLGDRKGLDLPDSEPYIFQFNSNNTFVVYNKNGKRKLAETRGVFTEMAYSSTDQDILFYDDSMTRVMLLLLASLTLSWNTGSYHA